MTLRPLITPRHGAAPGSLQLTGAWKSQPMLQHPAQPCTSLTGPKGAAGEQREPGSNNSRGASQRCQLPAGGLEVSVAIICSRPQIPEPFHPWSKGKHSVTFSSMLKTGRMCWGNQNAGEGVWKCAGMKRNLQNQGIQASLALTDIQVVTAPLWVF